MYWVLPASCLYVALASADRNDCRGSMVTAMGICFRLFEWELCLEKEEIHILPIALQRSGAESVFFFVRISLPVEDPNQRLVSVKYMLPIAGDLSTLENSDFVTLL